jgi:hypothetical protein
LETIGQSPSIAHASHFWNCKPAVWMQTPERHSLLAVQVPSPGAKPQRSSAGSQAPLTQARLPTAGDVQPPVTESPFLPIGWQLDVPPLTEHQLPEPQSLSCWQVALQVPSVVLQYGSVASQAPPGAPKFAEQRSQTWTPLQTGVVPEQAACSVLVHWTQAFAVVLHTVFPA